jgi:hypothetical protein
MMIATFFWGSLMIGPEVQGRASSPFAAMQQPLSILRTGMSDFSSKRRGTQNLCDDIGNNLIFQPLKLVLDRQLLLFHALDLQGITAGVDHRGDGGVEVGMVLPQTRKGKADFGLFLFCHRLPVIDFGWRSGCVNNRPARSRIARRT